jgi:two-component system sensor histidine kinase RpfC
MTGTPCSGGVGLGIFEMSDGRSPAEPESLIKRVVRRLRARPDSEHEMRFNGIVLSTATVAYLLATGHLGTGDIDVYAAYAGACLLVFGHILLRPQACITRRVVAMIGDFGALACEMHIRDETAAFLFPLFIWIILGNGFRFGAGFLALATAGGLAAFGAVIATTSFWGSQTALSAGLLGSMLLVSFAVAPLIRSLSRAKRQAEAASREKAVLLANVGHELRTPLTTILGTGSVLQDPTLDPVQREMTQQVVSAGQQVLTLADDISAVSGFGAADADRPHDRSGPSRDIDRTGQP